jgi:hypothetical protein
MRTFAEALKEKLSQEQVLKKFGIKVSDFTGPMKTAKMGDVEVWVQRPMPAERGREDAVYVHVLKPDRAAFKKAAKAEKLKVIDASNGRFIVE